MRERVLSTITSPVTVAMVVAFVLGAALITVTGSDPLSAFTELWRGALTGSGPRNSLSRAIPIIGMALAVSVSFRAGILNLGGEGQLLLGGVAGAATAIWMPGPGPIVIVAAIAAGSVVGMLWAVVSALGQTHLQLPVLITSLLLNYVARALSGYLVRFPFADEGSVLASTPLVPESNRIPRVPILGGVSLTMAIMVVLVIVMAVAYKRSVPGYESALVGINGRFARYGGVPVKRRTIGVMAVAGAIGGLVGTHMVIGDAYRYVDGELVIAGFAWTGLMVALLANNRPGPILAAGLFFAALQIGGLAMDRKAGVSWQLAEVIQAIVIVALVARFVIPRRGRWAKRSDPAEVPGAVPEGQV